MDGERLRGMLGCFGMVAGFGALLWLGSLWLGWAGTLTATAVLLAVFHMLIQRLGDATLFVSLAIGIVSIDQLLGPEAGTIHWISLIVAVIGAISGFRTSARESRGRASATYPT